MGDVHYIYRHGRKIEVKTLYTGAVPTKKRRPDRFVQVPELWLEKQLPALTSSSRWLAIVLLWHSFQHRGHAFICPNLERYGIDRNVKSRGLLELKRAGLITVQRALGKSPKVKITG
jgi:hypothetical protein